MSAEADDLFRRPADEEVRRDQWGRPLILAPDGQSERSYTRASTLAKALDDNTKLGEWKARMVGKGVSTNPDLIASYAALDTTFNAVKIKAAEAVLELAQKGLGDTPVSVAKKLLAAERRAAKEERARAKELMEMAMERAGATRRRELGTALHRFTEMHDKGEKIPYVPEELRPTLQEYIDKTRHIRWVGTEMFVVNDELHAAGTADRFGISYFGDGRARVYDVKTGSVDYGALAFEVQLATYANSVVYDPRTYARTPLSETVGAEIDLDRGVIIHLDPIEQRCTLHEVDLRRGIRAAHAGNFIVEWRKAKVSAELISEILAAKSKAELNEIFDRTKERWTDHERRAATHRAKELSA